MEKFIERKQEDKKAFNVLVIKKIGIVAGTNDQIKNVFKEKEQTYQHIKEHLMIIQTILDSSAPLDTIFLHDFLEKTFLINDTSDSKRIDTIHHFHDILYCFKRIIVKVASNGGLSETLINLKFLDSV